MREGFQNWIIVFSIIVVSGIILYFALPKENYPDSEGVMGVESVDYRNVPYITSVAPVSIEVGEKLEYIVEFSDLDSSQDEIKIYLTESPMWMYIEDDRIKGVPVVEGTYKYIVTVSDGINSSSQINYILVEDNG
jgi:hypothetical protein